MVGCCFCQAAIKAAGERLNIPITHSHAKEEEWNASSLGIMDTPEDEEEEESLNDPFSRGMIARRLVHLSHTRILSMKAE